LLAAGRCGPPKKMKNTFCPATALQGSVAFSFVIPSKPRDLQFSGLVLEMFFDRTALDRLSNSKPFTVISLRLLRYGIYTRLRGPCSCLGGA
jgi:hypothetical protein